MSKALYLSTLLLITACTFDPSGLPAQPSDATADSSAQADASEPDAMADALIADAPLPDALIPDAPLPDAPIPDAPLPDAPLPACATDPNYLPDPMTGRQYRFYDVNRTWALAHGDCEVNGAHLVVIDDQDENDYVRSLYNNSLWIGFNDIDSEGNWVWVTGAPATYTNWQSGEPNNSNGNEHCAEMRGSSSAWNDANCDGGHRFVCECDPSIPPP